MNQAPFPATLKLPWKRLALWFALSRLALFVVAGLSLLLVPPGDFPVHTNVSEWLNHWDAGWYLSIARGGYSYDPNGQSNAAFFPLYPMLVRGVSLVIPNLLVAGYVLSNSLLLASGLLFWKLIARDYGNAALADRAVLLLLICPLTIFYSSFYTESLFLFLALSTAYFAGGQSWLAAGGCAFLAALTRPPGALLVVLIAFEYGRAVAQRRREGRPAFTAGEGLSVLFAMLLPPCALAGFGYYLFVKFHDAKVLFHVHDHWSQHMIAPWNILGSGLIYHAFYIIWFYSALFIGLTLAVLAWRYRLRPSHLAMLYTFLLLYCTNSLLEALPRYLSVLFPFYLVLAQLCLRHPRWERPLLGASAALAALSVVLFVDGYWFT